MKFITAPEAFWVIFGFTGQAFFFLRFLIQWLKSEEEKKSLIPLSFWYFSLIGSFFLFAYALHKKDIVFMTGQSLGCFVYMRNLYLISREKAEK